MGFNIYLSVEIHTDWREKIIAGCNQENLEISFSSAVTNHEASDRAGDALGKDSNNVWRNQKPEKVNEIRTKILIKNSDIAEIVTYVPWKESTTRTIVAVKSQPLLLPRG